LGADASSTDFLFEPGAGFEYSGQAFLYLQKVIETITKKDLSALADELVFTPLAMTDSSFRWEDRYAGRVATSYDASGEAYPVKAEPVQAYAAWSLFTTLEDYARFVGFMITSSRVKGAAADLMLRPAMNVAQGVKWGLGWGLQETPPNDSFWHWGSMAGFRHFVVAYPAEGIAVIVMTNSASAFKMVEKVMIKAIGGRFPAYAWF